MTHASASSVSVSLAPGFQAFRTHALALLSRDVRPERVHWLSPEQTSLFDAPSAETTVSHGARPKVPADFVAVAQRVAHHRSLERADVLYRVLYRLTHGEPWLLRAASDADVARLIQLDAQVRRSAHKTKAFVRFRKVDDDEGQRFVAFHAPEHPILPLVSDFFRERFSDMRFHIITPDASLWFDGACCHFGPGMPRSAAPSSDSLEELWRTYYRSIFNPARVMVKAMQTEMPKRHWRTLPETADIPSLIAEAPARVRSMLAQNQSAPTAQTLIHETDDLPALARSASACAACPLHRSATQTVFGQGPHDAQLVLVGEQPGDEEDLRGEPFVGPAGEVLNQVLFEVGLDRHKLYLTNAVKHFHFVPREGKKRLHQKPGTGHVRACRPWLIAELERITPRIIVCMGVTAARSLLGAEVKLERDRGIVQKTPWGRALITYHPSAVLRAKNDEERSQILSALRADLKTAGDVALIQPSTAASL